MLSELRGATQSRRRGSSLVNAILGAAVVAVVFTPVHAIATQPARALDVSSITGCCACRGTKNGEKTSLKSCSDGLTPESCQSQCDSQNAGSMAFGYQQACSQGCAGFATQNPK